MVSINKIISSPIVNVQPHNVQKAVKKAAPVAGGLAVLAGALHYSPGEDLLRIEDPSYIPYTGEQADMIADNIYDSASAVVSNIADGASDVAGAIADGLGSASDSVADIAINVLDKILDVVG